MVALVQLPADTIYFKAAVADVDPDVCSNTVCAEWAAPRRK